MAGGIDFSVLADDSTGASPHAEPGTVERAAGTGAILQLARSQRFAAKHCQLAVAEELREIARAVRRIGRGRGASPEAILIEKSEAAERLFALAARIEVAT